MKPRYLFVNRYFYPDESATSQMLTDLTFDLAARGYQVTVITGRQRIDDPQAPLLPVERASDVLIYRVWTTRWGRANLLGRAIDYLTFYISAAVRLFIVARKGDVVVAKTDPPLIGDLAAVVARLKRARLINWWQDVYPEIAVQLGVNAIKPVARPLIWLRNRACRAAVVNVVIGRCMLDRLVAAGASEEQITVIPNWADDLAIQPLAPAENSLRQDWALGRSFVVGYSGNLGRGHDFDVLLDAALALKDEARIRFLFVGSGAGKAAVLGRVEDLGLQNVMFRPFQPRSQLGLSLTLPDVHIVSLKPELSGLIVPSKFYGALAAGRPLIFLGPESSEIARVIHECSCGFVFENARSDELAEAIRLLQVDFDLCEELGRNARKAVDDRYNKSASLEAWRAKLDGAAG